MAKAKLTPRDLVGCEYTSIHGIERMGFDDVWIGPNVDFGAESYDDVLAGPMIGGGCHEFGTSLFGDDWAALNEHHCVMEVEVTIRVIRVATNNGFTICE